MIWFKCLMLNVTDCLEVQDQWPQCQMDRFLVVVAAQSSNNQMLATAFWCVLLAYVFFCYWETSNNIQNALTLRKTHNSSYSRDKQYRLEATAATLTTNKIFFVLF